MYYIYFEDKVINFARSPEGAFDRVVELSEDQKIGIAKMLENLENSKYLCVKAADPKRAFDQFCAQFESVEAAGGVVSNKRGELLMIYRRGKWDLPKGHVDPGETSEQAALREVCEETGVCGASLGDRVATTLHFYHMNDRWELKRTAWYSMRAESCQLIPQSEEGIARVEWVDKALVGVYACQTYSSVRDVLNAAEWIESKHA